MKVLIEHIKKKTYKNVYLLSGEEPYLRLQYRDKLKAALVPEDDTMNINRFEGRESDEKAILSLCDTMPFFGDRRLVVVENSGFFASSGHDRLAEYLPDIPETSFLIFVEEDVDKRGKLYKAVKKYGYAAEFAVPNDKVLMQWLASLAGKAGKRVREETLRYFLQLVAHDMFTMSMEMEKLISYVGERDVIEDADLEEICCVHVENKVFDMITEVLSGHQGRAMSLYKDLMALKEPPIRILYLINKQLDSLYQVRLLADKGYPAPVIAEKTGIRDFIVRRTLPLCHNYDADRIRQMLEQGVAMDEAVKTGKIADHMAVEVMIASLGQ